MLTYSIVFVVGVTMTSLLTIVWIKFERVRDPHLKGGNITQVQLTRLQRQRMMLVVGSNKISVLPRYVEGIIFLTISPAVKWTVVEKRTPNKIGTLQTNNLLIPEETCLKLLPTQQGVEIGRNTLTIWGKPSLQPQIRLTGSTSCSDFRLLTLTRTLIGCCIFPRGYAPRWRLNARSSQSQRDSATIDTAGSTTVAASKAATKALTSAAT